jgi:uncharacterized protein
VNDLSDVELSVHSLHIYPIKSCGGITLDKSLLIETGLDLDRAWMVVDEQRRFVTQRDLPRMALIRPTLKHDDVVLRAPGMLALHLSLNGVEAPLRVQVWNDWVSAYDMGDLAAFWFTNFLAPPRPPPGGVRPPEGEQGNLGRPGVSLGRKLRLVRFDPEQRRLSNQKWTGAIEAENAFSDGYPLLVTSTASLLELNQRLQTQGQPAVTLARMRPNLVLDGLEAHGEDHLDEIAFTLEAGAVRLKLVKPCVRCQIPDIDPLTAETGHAVGDVMASYRADARMNGAITFGMNAVIVEGVEQALHAGLRGSATYRFG